MARVLVSVGSNMEPERNLALAAREMNGEFDSVRFSAAYRNAAVGFEGPDFINCVVEFRTTLVPRELVERLRRIEELCGRPRHAPKWAPRSMDLDLLTYDELVLDDEDIKLPRPDLVKRVYMLGPAAELAPDVKHPVLGKTLGELWSAFDVNGHTMTRVPLGLEGQADA